MKVMQVPHLPSLRVNDILMSAREKLNIDDYIPKFKSVTKVPDRCWL